MDEQNSKKETPKKNRSTRPLSDPTDGIKQAKEDSRARHRYGGQSEHRVRGLSWYKLLILVLGACAVAATIIAAFMQRDETLFMQRINTLSTMKKERARVVLSDTRDVRIEPDPALSFSLIFKNVGETTALNTYGTRLQGECPYSSSQECIQWCLKPLREAQGEGYGPLVPQDEYKEEVFYILKTVRARQKKPPIYFCGYFAYTDVFCVWRRKFYVLSYDHRAELLTTHILGKDEEEAQVENCSP